MGLCDRMEELGHTIGAREAPHTPAIELARAKAEGLRASLRDAFGRFHAAAEKAGAAHLQIVVGPVRLDEKHVRSIEFDVTRGRYRTVITVKSRGEVTLVGPFRKGGTEGPCRTFPIDADAEIERALAEVLERFLEEATAP
jgi:hypothetical protein